MSEDEETSSSRNSGGEDEEYSGSDVESSSVSHHTGSSSTTHREEDESSQSDNEHSSASSKSENDEASELSSSSGAGSSHSRRSSKHRHKSSRKSTKHHDRREKREEEIPTSRAKDSKLIYGHLAPASSSANKWWEPYQSPSMIPPSKPILQPPISTPQQSKRDEAHKSRRKEKKSKEKHKHRERRKEKEDNNKPSSSSTSDSTATPLHLRLLATQKKNAPLAKNRQIVYWPLRISHARPGTFKAIIAHKPAVSALPPLDYFDKETLRSITSQLSTETRSIVQGWVLMDYSNIRNNNLAAPAHVWIRISENDLRKIQERKSEHRVIMSGTLGVWLHMAVTSAFNMQEAYLTEWRPEAK